MEFDVPRFACEWETAKTALACCGIIPTVRVGKFDSIAGRLRPLSLATTGGCDTLAISVVFVLGLGRSRCFSRVARNKLRRENNKTTPA